MKPESECGTCLMHWVYERVAPHADEGKAGRIWPTMLKTLLREINPGANVGALCNKAVAGVLPFSPRAALHYEELKRQSNENAMALLPEARNFVMSGQTRREALERSCLLAAASNVAPISSPSAAYTFHEIGSIIRGGSSSRFFIGDVYDIVRAARHVLYVADNAGEIGFDSLVIDVLKELGAKVTLVVKEKTFFEDATLDDARFFGIDAKVDQWVTAEGFFAPCEISPELREAFGRCDLVVGKGTGTYEALHGEMAGKPLVVMLKVKCRPIARQTGALEGEVVIGLDRPGALMSRAGKIWPWLATVAEGSHPKPDMTEQ
ncbi:MAG: ARMT1-like domain-containing protein [Syntrophorhabdales bacterium]|jgi:uncharacterized protein with ATP-grasp and redox domains